MLKTFSLYFCGMMILLLISIVAHNAWDMPFTMLVNDFAAAAGLSGIYTLLVELYHRFWDRF
jgi:hypothetical protein